MANRVMRVRTRGDQPTEGIVRFVSMTLGPRGAARVRLDDAIATALAHEGSSGRSMDPTPTELSFVGDTELDALSLAESWVRKTFEVINVSTTRMKKPDGAATPQA